MRFRKKCNFLVSMMLACSMVFASCTAKDQPAANQTEPTKNEPTAAQAAPQSGDHEPVTLRIYAQYSDEDTKAPYDYAVAELKKEMPYVTLELDIQAQDDGQKLKTYAATGNMPDIYNAGLDLINTFVKSNNIVDLTTYAQQLGFVDKVYESAKNILYHPDGKIYAFPYAGHEMILLYVNKQLFEENNIKIPQTYDELLQAVDAFNAAGITPLSLFAKEKWPCVALYDEMVTRYEPLGIKGLDTGETQITEEAYTKAAENIVTLVEHGLLPKGATNLNYDQAASLFHTGKAAMFLNGQWEIEASTNALGDKVDWIPFPATAIDKIDTSQYAVSGSGSVGGFAVSPSTPDVELAAKVAAFMAEKYAEFKYTERANPIVALKVEKEIVTPYPPMMEKLSEFLPKITSTTCFAWGVSQPKYKAMLEDETQQLLAGGYSADSFIKNIAKSLQK